MWIKYAVHAIYSHQGSEACISSLPWTRRLPLTSEEALSAHASIIATRWCTGSPVRTWRSSNECKMRWSVSFVHWGFGTLYQEPDVYLHWLPIGTADHFQDCCTNIQLSPEVGSTHRMYLCDLVHDYLPGRALRSGDMVTLEVPRTQIGYSMSELSESQGQPFGMTFLSNWDSLPISMDLKLNLKLIIFTTY